MGDGNGVPGEGVMFSREWMLMELTQHSPSFLAITCKRENTTKLRSSIRDQINNVINNETLTHLKVYMQELFGKGKKAHIFHSIIISDDLEIVQRSVIAVPNSFIDSQDQFIIMRVHELIPPFPMRGVSFIGEERVN